VILFDHRVLRAVSKGLCGIASKLAGQVGAIGDNFTKHALIDVGEDNDAHYTRIGNCAGCSLPDSNLNVFDEPGVLSDDYELFVRLSRSNDNKLLAEGFTSFTTDIDGRHGGALSLNHLDLSEWPQLLEISRLLVLHSDDDYLDFEDELLDECMPNLTGCITATSRHHFTNNWPSACPNCTTAKHFSQQSLLDRSSGDTSWTLYE